MASTDALTTARGQTTEAPWSHPPEATDSPSSALAERAKVANDWAAWCLVVAAERDEQAAELRRQAEVYAQTAKRYASAAESLAGE